ncbi:hypothetical protein ACPUYX_03675 [Desulfosporosinus sp. SYSU MS00001]|uniref:hypothetical protein n=1 Tax=Desulfosporosinus sp. SYSU MS00001 TaxID=3416284 RepID=UPI003CF0D8A8
MESFKSFVYESIKDNILSWNDNLTSDIYAISLYISNVLDDPRRPMVTLGFNTYNNFRQAIQKASGEDEAKWNYAFWLQNEELVIGDNYDNNLEGGIQVTNWIKDLGLYYTDEQERDDFEKVIKQGEKITRAFVELCIDVVGRLHAEGVIKNKFRKEIPVIIHELEYYDEIAEQNKKANPQNTIKEFVEWIYRM